MSWIVDMRHKIYKGKYKTSPMPSALGRKPHRKQEHTISSYEKKDKERILLFYFGINFEPHRIFKVGDWEKDMFAAYWIALRVNDTDT